MSDETVKASDAIADTPPTDAEKSEDPTTDAASTSTTDTADGPADATDGTTTGKSQTELDAEKSVEESQQAYEAAVRELNDVRVQEGTGGVPGQREVPTEPPGPMAPGEPEDTPVTVDELATGANQLRGLGLPKVATVLDQKAESIISEQSDPQHETIHTSPEDPTT